MLKILVLLAALSAPCQFPVCTPAWVAERYDSIVVLIDPENEHGTRVFFIRGSRIFADRLLTEDMVFTGCGAGWSLQWEDWCSCDRLVYFDSLCIIVEHRTYSDDGAWWAAGRPMVELAQPAGAAP